MFYILDLSFLLLSAIEFLRNSAIQVKFINLFIIMIWYGMPEHLDARTTTIRDIFHCILADQNFRVKKRENKNLPPDHKISGKRTLTVYFFLLGLK